MKRNINNLVPSYLRSEGNELFRLKHNNQISLYTPTDKPKTSVVLRKVINGDILDISTSSAPFPTGNCWEKTSWEDVVKEFGEEVFVDRSNWFTTKYFILLRDISEDLRFTFDEETRKYIVYDIKDHHRKDLVARIVLNRLFDILKLDIAEIIGGEQPKSTSLALMELAELEWNDQWLAELYIRGEVFANSIKRYKEIEVLKWLFVNERHKVYLSFRDDGYIEKIYTRDPEVARKLDAISCFLSMDTTMPIECIGKDEDVSYSQYNLGEAFVNYLQENEEVTRILQEMYQKYNLYYGEFANMFTYLNQAEYDKYFNKQLRGKFNLTPMKDPIINKEIRLTHGNVKVILPSGQSVTISSLKGKEKIHIEN